jgi:hypothetical protein
MQLARANEKPQVQTPDLSYRSSRANFLTCASAYEATGDEDELVTTPVGPAGRAIQRIR